MKPVQDGVPDKMGRNQEQNPSTDPEVLSSALKVGALSGSYPFPLTLSIAVHCICHYSTDGIFFRLIVFLAFGGFAYGGVSGVLRSSPHPVIRSISYGIHWFACGSSFWCQYGRGGSSWIMLIRAIGLRSNILKIHYADNATPKERAYTSALSGGIAGGGVTRLMGTVSRLPLSPSWPDADLVYRRPTRARHRGVFASGLSRTEFLEYDRAMAIGERRHETDSSAHCRFEVGSAAVSFGRRLQAHPERKAPEY